MKNTKLNQFDVIKAAFNPKRTYDLKPGSEEFIGLLLEWECLWIIEEGEYKGQMALALNHLTLKPPFSWVPECDLEISPLETDELTGVYNVLNMLEDKDLINDFEKELNEFEDKLLFCGEMDPEYIRIQNAIKEAKRFIKIAKEQQGHIKATYFEKLTSEESGARHWPSGRNTHRAATKRAAVDLRRNLVQITQSHRG